MAYIGKFATKVDPLRVFFSNLYSLCILPCWTRIQLKKLLLSPSVFFSTNRKPTESGSFPIRMHPETFSIDPDFVGPVKKRFDVSECRGCVWHPFLHSHRTPFLGPKKKITRPSVQNFLSETFERWEESVEDVLSIFSFHLSKFPDLKFLTVGCVFCFRPLKKSSVWVGGGAWVISPHLHITPFPGHPRSIFNQVHWKGKMQKLRASSLPHLRWTSVPNTPKKLKRPSDKIREINGSKIK